MSTDLYIALPGPPPARRDLLSILEDFGGVTGDWPELEIAGNRLWSEADVEHVGPALRRARNKLRVESLLVMTMTNDFAIDIGIALAEITGGVVISEDGELLYAARVSRRPPTTLRSPAIDVSIPDDVRRRFGNAHFRVVTRERAAVKMSRLVSALPRRPEGVGYARHGGLDLQIGSIMLCDRGLSGTYEHLGVARAEAMVFTAFEYWHIASAPQAEWDAILGVACGLARQTRGVIYDGSEVYDFSPAGTSSQT